jgi:hypothetical protein
MTRLAVPATVERTGRALPALARAEARRILTHPVDLLLGLYLVMIGGVETSQLGLPSRDTTQDVLALLGYLCAGVFTFFAANLVASSARRSRAASQLEAAPTGPQAQTLGTCLGVLGPALVATAVAAALWFVGHTGPDLDRALSVPEVAAIPLCTLGAGLLGVAVARWLPWPGAPAVVMVGLIAWIVAVSSRGDLLWTMPWSTSPNYHDDPSLLAGSQVWHGAYLLGLGLLAGVAALLRHPPHRRALLLLGGVLGAGVLLAGVAQLP